MEIKSPNMAWDLTTYWYRKYKIDKYDFDLKDSFFIETHVFPFSTKMNIVSVPENLFCDILNHPVPTIDPY